MATPRSRLVDPKVPLHYHLTSRCVRRSYLCGRDRRTGRDYGHRKRWLIDAMTFLARHHPVAIMGYAIMDNHFHLVVYYDPGEAARWSDLEVVTRWLAVHPPRVSESASAEEREAALELSRDALLADPEQIERVRASLGSLSHFMKCLKQPVACRANREDRCTGHFFEGRFHSSAILDEESLQAAMAYVDLNPVKDGILRNFERYDAASGQLRVRKTTEAGLHRAVAPLVSGISGDVPCVSFTLGEYLSLLRECQAGYLRRRKSESKESVWFSRVASIRKRQRAYGLKDNLNEWCADRNWRVKGDPLPAD